jgi:hypothetical protein
LFDCIVPAIIYNHTVLVVCEIVIHDVILLSVVYVDTLNIVVTIVVLDGVVITIEDINTIFTPTAAVVANCVIVRKPQEDWNRTISDVLIIDCNFRAVGQYYLSVGI